MTCLTVIHEGTITFAGEWLLSKIKEERNDWGKHTSFDIKN
jgi:hypothetical protein